MNSARGGAKLKAAFFQHNKVLANPWDIAVDTDLLPDDSSNLINKNAIKTSAAE